MTWRVCFGDGRELDAASRATKWVCDCDEAPSGYALRRAILKLTGELTGQQQVLSWSTVRERTVPFLLRDSKATHGDRVEGS